ncbi:MAG: dethiobiotin synthase [Candidatus Nanopelagicales bacterium]
MDSTRTLDDLVTGPLIITGTGTEVGKTIVTAALAAAALRAGMTVAAVKPVQTGLSPGEPGDVQEVGRLSGCPTCLELLRYPDPLAPAAAARVSGLPEPDLEELAERIAALSRDVDLVLVEGAGGLLVPFDGAGRTLVDLCRLVSARTGRRVPFAVVADPALGTLNHTALTLASLDAAGLDVAGVVLGSWPSDPDLACRSNLADLPAIVGAPLAGVLPAGSAALDREAFAAAAVAGMAPRFGGTFSGTMTA